MAGEVGIFFNLKRYATYKTTVLNVVDDRAQTKSRE